MKACHSESVFGRSSRESHAHEELSRVNKVRADSFLLDGRGIPLCLWLRRAHPRGCHSEVARPGRATEESLFCLISGRCHSEDSASGGRRWGPQHAPPLRALGCWRRGPQHAPPLRALECWRGICSPVLRVPHLSRPSASRARAFKKETRKVGSVTLAGHATGVR